MSRTPRSAARRTALGLAVLARLACIACLAALAFALAPGRAHAQGPDDPLAPMVRRMDRYLQLNQQEGGVTMDWRYALNPSEEIRQTVVCQLLAYVELYRLDPRARLRVEIVRHADFMIGRLADIRSYSPFDGMLAYALLGAYETTGEARFLAVGTQVTNDLLAIPTGQCVLNGGLMVAMATAQYAHLTGDAVADQKTHDIIAQLVPYQNADGSFPHWCWGSRDIHYTGWMSFELIHLRRLTDDAHIPVFLSSMSAFLEGRIAPDGRAVYEEPCPDFPGCMEYYYSRASGCDYDYDSRGWTVEPAYCSLLFDAMGSPKYTPVMNFLTSLENGGTFKDLYAYWPPPSDPEYPWCIADTSVVNMSIIFWAFATEVTDRIQRGVPVDLQLDDLIDTTTVPPVPPPVTYAPLPLAVEPNPARGACALHYTLAAACEGSLEIYDAGGRRVRVLERGTLARGPHAPRWNGRDADGRTVSGGVYFARLRAGAVEQTRRIALAP
jgi:hypothetical protein